MIYINHAYIYIYIYILSNLVKTHVYVYVYIRSHIIHISSNAFYLIYDT